MFLWTFTHIKLASHKSKLHLPAVTSLVTKCTFLSVASTLASTSLHFSSRVFAAEKYDLTHHKMFLHLEAGPRMCEAIIKHCKNCECCPVSLLIVKSQRLSEFRFSIVRIVISVSNVTSLVFATVKMVKNTIVKNCPNCQKCQKLSKFKKKLKI